MHSIIHSELKTYIVDEHSDATYQRIHDAAGFAGRSFDEGIYYNDSDLDSILSAAETELNMERHEILRAYGIHVAPTLIANFSGMMEDGWRTFDFLEASESKMHKYVREEMGAFPPALKTKRISDNELILSYKSHRNMWGLSVGFVEGIASHYGDSVTVDLSHSGYDGSLTIRLQ